MALETVISTKIQATVDKSSIEKAVLDIEKKLEKISKVKVVIQSDLTSFEDVKKKAKELEDTLKNLQKSQKINVDIDDKNVKDKLKQVSDALQKTNTKQLFEIKANFDEVGLRQQLEKSLENVKLFARDTKKEIDKARYIELNMDIARASTALNEVRAMLREAKKEGNIQAVATLVLEETKFSSELTEAKRKLQNLKNTGDETVSRLQAKFDNLGDAVKRNFLAIKEGFSQIMSGAGLLVTGGIAYGIGSLTKSIVQLSDNLEKNKIAFETMLGSAEKADKLLRDLSEFAKKTPFELTGIRETAKQLLAMGISVEDLIPTMKALGDVSAGLSVDMSRLALAYGQVISKGKLQGGELKQFTEAGVPLLETLSKMLGKTTTEIYKMIEAGQISSKVVVDAFRIMTSEGGQFANLMEKQTKTLSGMRSNFIDTLSQLGERIGMLVLPILKKVVDVFLQLGDKIGTFILPIFRNVFDTLSQFWTSTLPAFKKIFDTLSQFGIVALPIFKKAFEILSQFWEIILPISNKVFEAFSQFGQIIGTLVLPALNKVADILSRLLDKIGTLVLPALKKVVDILIIATDKVVAFGNAFALSLKHAGGPLGYLQDKMIALMDGTYKASKSIEAMKMNLEKMGITINSSVPAMQSIIDKNKQYVNNLEEIKIKIKENEELYKKGIITKQQLNTEYEQLIDKGNKLADTIRNNGIILQELNNIEQKRKQITMELKKVYDDEKLTAEQKYQIYNQYKQKLIELDMQERKYLETHKILADVTGYVNGELNKLSTAKSRAEFEAMRQQVIKNIQTQMQYIEALRNSIQAQLIAFNNVKNKIGEGISGLAQKLGLGDFGKKVESTLKNVTFFPKEERNKVEALNRQYDELKKSLEQINKLTYKPSVPSIPTTTTVSTPKSSGKSSKSSIEDEYKAELEARKRLAEKRKEVERELTQFFEKEVDKRYKKVEDYNRRIIDLDNEVLESRKKLQEKLEDLEQDKNSRLVKRIIEIDERLKEGKLSSETKKKLEKEKEDIEKQVMDIEVKISQTFDPNDLKELNKERDKLIEKLDKINEKLKEGMLTEEEVAKLEQERAKAFAGLSQQQIEQLNKMIEKQKEYNSLSEIEKILFDYEQKKQALIQEQQLYEQKAMREIELIKMRRDEELNAISSLEQARQNYLNKIDEMTNRELQKLDLMIDKRSKLIEQMEKNAEMAKANQVINKTTNYTYNYQTDNKKIQQTVVMPKTPTKKTLKKLRKF